MRICKAFTAVPVLMLALFVAMAQADDRAIKRRTDAADGPEKRYALIIGNGDYSVGRLKKILVRDVYLARSSGYDESKPGDGWLTVKANVPGAEVWVNDSKYGKAPLTLKMVENVEYRIRVTAVGYEPYTKRVVMKPDEDRKVNALLEGVTNSLGMAFVWIEPGSFMMGSPEDEPGRNDDETQHWVTLTKGFYMGTTEVTRGQWQALMEENPSEFEDCGDDCPVENVTWDGVQEFIQKLNRRDRANYRLPTEAEWEYAARAGTTTPFSYGIGLSKCQANCAGRDLLRGCGKGEYRRQTIPVGSLNAPNAWGLHDMHGNVWELCADWYGEYPTGAVIDPVGPDSGENHVLRGGSLANFARDCRSAIRIRDIPMDRFFYVGFRLVRSSP